MAKPSAATLAKTAAEKAAMEARISKAAADLAVAAPSLASTKGKTYETWVMFEIAARLAISHKVKARNSAGKSTTTFRVRGGPGHIKSASEPPGKLPCHFELGSPQAREPLELHNSVEHVGLSDETHEFDVSAISKRYTSGLRKSAKGGPYEGPCALGLELKAYDDATTLDKAIARALLGTVVDLHPGAVVKSVKIEFRAKASDTYVERFGYPRAALLTTAWITPETRKFLEAYGIGSHPNVAPGHNEGDLDALASMIRPWL
jgi:hypothetical protein